MSFAAIAHTSPFYADQFVNYWLKAYEPGTTTPKLIATDEAGGTTVAKVELNSDGLPHTAGNALFIPHVDGAYDLWLFPTAAEADANDTTNAKKLADDSLPSKARATKEAVWSFDTLNNAVIEEDDERMFDGATIYLVDRTTGNGGGFHANVILESSVTTNAMDIIACTGIDTLAIRIVKGEETMKTLGAIAGQDASAILTRLLAIRTNAIIGEFSSPPLVSAITMPTNKTISDGKLATTSNATMITLATDAAIKNVELIGTGKASGDTLQNLVFDPTSAVGVTLENVKLRDAGGSGFLPAVTVTGEFFGGTLVNVDALDCNIGLNFVERGEYFNIMGGHVHGCTQGIIDIAGNVNFNNTIVTDNTEGFRLGAGTNDAHGIISGLQINHNTTNLVIEAINTKTQEFTNCHIYEGIIHLIGCEGITFDGGSWGVVTVREEGCFNCFVKGVRINDQIVSEPNFNATTSELLYYGTIRDTVTNGAVDASYIQGVYCVAILSASITGITTGTKQVVLINQLTQETAFNSAYTKQLLYNTSTGELPLKTLNLKGGRWVTINASLTVGRSDSVDLDPELCRVYLRNKTSGAINAQFRAGVQEPSGAVRLRVYEIDVNLIKENYEIVVENNTGVDLTVFNDLPSNVTFQQLSRMTIQEVN